MANVLYDKGRQKFLEGDIAWLTDTIKCCFVDGADYTPDLGNDEFLDDIPAGARVGTPVTLSGKTSTNGVADADDAVFTSVTGDESEYIAIWKDTGAEGTSPLIALIDTATNLPVTPNGGNITIQWPSGADKIFKL